MKVVVGKAHSVSSLVFLTAGFFRLMTGDEESDPLSEESELPELPLLREAGFLLLPEDESLPELPELSELSDPLLLSLSSFLGFLL